MTTTALQITPSGQALGATVAGLDLRQPLSAEAYQAVLGALGTYGVLRFPGQHLGPAELKTFSAHFGTLEVNVASQGGEHPEVMTLSNIVVDGKPIYNSGKAKFGLHNLTDALTFSINTTFAEIGDKLGGRKLGAEMNRFGFARPTEIEIGRAHV